jgi:hypothetical protein
MRQKATAGFPEGTRLKEVQAGQSGAPDCIGTHPRRVPTEHNITTALGFVKGKGAGK